MDCFVASLLAMTALEISAQSMLSCAIMKRLRSKKLSPMHPGEVLREEFLLPLGLSPGAVAKACGVPRTRIERLSNEETGVTADTALRLSKVFGTSPELWLNLQTDYDVQIAKRQIGKDLAKIGPIRTRAA
jgi:addiction module HigA family antidote